MHLIYCVNKSQFVLVWPKPYNTEQQRATESLPVPFGAPYVALSAYWPLTGTLISQNVKIVVCLVGFCYKIYV